MNPTFPIPPVPLRFDRPGASRHKRNTAGMHQSPRCGAKTRSGSPCKSPAVSGKARCRMHGGAAGSGGQPGNRNALKHGRYSRREALRRAQLLQQGEPGLLHYALVHALETAPPLPAPRDALPPLADAVAAFGIDPYAALTLATAPGLGVTVWRRRGLDIGAAWHRLGAMQERLLGPAALESWAVLMAGAVPAPGVDMPDFSKNRFHTEAEGGPAEGFGKDFSSDSNTLGDEPAGPAGRGSAHAQ